MPTIPDFTSKNFLDSGILITLHGAKHYYEQTPATELAFNWPRCFDHISRSVQRMDGTIPQV